MMANVKFLRENKMLLLKHHTKGCKSTENVMLSG
jgi:hypothetical protein